MKIIALIIMAILLFSCARPTQRYGNDAFPFTSAGKLSPSSSGTGRLGDQYVYAPGIRFPLESAPAYINSQVYGIGGLYGSKGSLCDARNFQYPWHDNYCEKRGWRMPLCPTGKGHQGVDIRPASCQRRQHYAVATERGIITSIGTYTIYLRGDSGRVYRYLHLDSATLQVQTGQRVRRGQRIGLVSDNMGNTKTSIHLHFDMKQSIRFNDGRSASVFVPPYTSLVDAYERLLSGNP